MDSDYEAAIGLWDEDLAICRTIGDELGVAHALFSLAKVALARGDHRKAEGLYGDSLARLRSLGDTRGVAAVLTDLGNLDFFEGNTEPAMARSTGALAIWRELGDRQGIARALTNLAEEHLILGHHREAERHLIEAQKISVEIGDRWGTAAASVGHGRLAFRLGKTDQAETLIRAGLETFHQLHDWVEVAGALESLAGTVVVQGRAEQATSLLAGAAALRAEIGVPLPPVYRPGVDRTCAMARERLGEEVFEAIWAVGRSLSRDEAMAVADRERVAPAPPGAKGPGYDHEALPGLRTWHMMAPVSALEGLRLVSLGFSTPGSGQLRPAQPNPADVLHATDAFAVLAGLVVAAAEVAADQVERAAALRALVGADAAAQRGDPVGRCLRSGIRRRRGLAGSR